MRGSRDSRKSKLQPPWQQAVLTGPGGSGKRAAAAQSVHLLAPPGDHDFGAMQTWQQQRLEHVWSAQGTLATQLALVRRSETTTRGIQATAAPPSCLTISKPMPLPPPVTSATLPTKTVGLKGLAGAADAMVLATRVNALTAGQEREVGHRAAALTGRGSHGVAHRASRLYSTAAPSVFSHHPCTLSILRALGTSDFTTTGLASRCARLRVLHTCPTPPHCPRGPANKKNITLCSLHAAHSGSHPCSECPALDLPELS